MSIIDLSNDALLAELGDRLRRARLNKNLTQGDLARQAGIARRTLQKAEEGDSPTLETVIAILRALGELAQLDLFLPPPPPSPLELAKQRGSLRQRATSPKKAKPPTKTWRWKN
ncbi:MAG: helix-turn-helix transcriptional regulator [Pirellulales bacterium]|nr:helix-turn-helix transcriptional regulator [Pirellulales bacterium]